ncbi:hypothetical protein ERJ75_001431500 [Trypanosoma vivax]|uniref:SAP domain-containing protein n=1 Tax=Trypanosoma vivax (strain Y486) TaxID=1055687 RepID=G0TTM3_TRYVY|nr:hypothetical protein TRVL_00087 [Trypanosoma vivax]KAH8607321.1 hypothetical protein ERJ75_001431500 [Trypanosoma vivax]CCC47304.1 conserved hypothetical protein [Trypanosoma vivax Y486]
MPFWNCFVVTKPEVDDKDLPLPKHRIYDDHGNLKPDVEQSMLNVDLGRGRTKPSAKKSITLTPKTRARILRSVGATPTAPPKGHKQATDASPDSPQPSKPRRGASPNTGVHDPSVAKVLYAPLAAKAPSTKRSQEMTPEKRGSSKRATTPKNTKGEKTPSRDELDELESVTSKTSRTSTKSRTSSKRSRSRSARKPKTPKSGSTAKRQRSPPSPTEATPTSKWTVEKLRSFAERKRIDITTCKTKAEMIARLKSRLDA